MLEHPAAWLTFCVSNPVTRTYVHFFPSSGPLAAPYQANCALTLLAPGKDAETVVLEGARLSQPDGVRIDQAFEDASDGAAVPLCLIVELTTPQPKVDLSASGCVVELASRGLSVKFRPSPLARPAAVLPFLAIRSARSSASLLSVNPAEAPRRASIKRASAAGSVPEGEPALSEAAVFDVPARSVSEIALNDAIFEGPQRCEGPWGSMDALGLYLDSASGELAHYIVYRDSDSQRLISVVAL